MYSIATVYSGSDNVHKYVAEINNNSPPIELAIGVTAVVIIIVVVAVAVVVVCYRLGHSSHIVKV